MARNVAGFSLPFPLTCAKVTGMQTIDCLYQSSLHTVDVGEPPEDGHLQLQRADVLSSLPEHHIDVRLAASTHRHYLLELPEPPQHHELERPPPP